MFWGMSLKAWDSQYTILPSHLQFLGQARWAPASTTSSTVGSSTNATLMPLSRLIKWKPKTLKRKHARWKAIKINRRQITKVNGVSNEALVKRWIWNATCLPPVLHFLLCKCLLVVFRLSYRTTTSTTRDSMTCVWLMSPQEDQEPLLSSPFSCTSSLNVAGISLSLDAEVFTINIFVKSLCWMLHSAGKEMSQSCWYLCAAKHAL